MYNNRSNFPGGNYSCDCYYCVWCPYSDSDSETESCDTCDYHHKEDEERKIPCSLLANGIKPKKTYCVCKGDYCKNLTVLNIKTIITILKECKHWNMIIGQKRPDDMSIIFNELRWMRPANLIFSDYHIDFSRESHAMKLNPFQRKHYLIEVSSKLHIFNDYSDYFKYIERIDKLLIKYPFFEYSGYDRTLNEINYYRHEFPFPKKKPQEFWRFDLIVNYSASIKKYTI